MLIPGRMTISGCPVRADQSRRVVSCPAVAISSPSGLNASPVTPAEWPRSRRPLAAARHVPDPDHSVVARGGQVRSVGAEGEITDPAGVGPESAGGGRCREVVEVGGVSAVVVGPYGREPGAVGAQGDRVVQPGGMGCERGARVAR